MTFNSKRGRVVLFGGLPVFAPQDPTLSDQVRGDTWEHVDQGTTLQSLVLVPSAGTIGSQITATVTLTQSAPPGGVTVTVTALGQSVSPALPATITIPANGTTGQLTFSIGPGPVVSPGVHTIEATSGEDTKTALLTIN